MRELEAKVKDQEEELDEQAGTIQMLEQVGGAAQPPDLRVQPEVWDRLRARTGGVEAVDFA